MRASTASLIMAFCAMLAVQAAPVTESEGSLALREAAPVAVVARTVDVEEREAKK